MTREPKANPKAEALAGISAVLEVLKDGAPIGTAVRGVLVARLEDAVGQVARLSVARVRKNGVEVPAPVIDMRVAEP